MEKEDIITLIAGGFTILIVTWAIISMLKETANSIEKIECYETYLLENAKLKKCESIFKKLYEEEKEE